MGRRWEKDIEKAKAAVASIGQRPERTDPMSRAEVESFIKGFGLSAAATRQVVDGWMADQDRSRDAGWESALDSCRYDG